MGTFIPSHHWVRDRQIRRTGIDAMKKNKREQLQINILGRAGSGKSTLARFIQSSLVNSGFAINDVTVEDEDDGDDRSVGKINNLLDRKVSIRVTQLRQRILS